MHKQRPPTPATCKPPPTSLTDICYGGAPLHNQIKPSAHKSIHTHQHFRARHHEAWLACILVKYERKLSCMKAETGEYTCRCRRCLRVHDTPRASDRAPQQEHSQNPSIPW